MWPLLGVGVLVLGFAARLNPLLVAVLAALTSGLLAWHDLDRTLAVLGKAFNENRLVAVVWLVLPVIGLLERYGLQAEARRLVARLRQASVGRLLLVYMIYRQVTAAVGLGAAGGPAQMVRPLIAPMAEALAETQAPADLTPAAGDRLRAFVRAQAAAADNIGAFYGEDIFIAVSSIVLIKGFLDSVGISVQPLQISVWAIPTAILALIVHGARLLRLDRRIAQFRVSSADSE
jgi:uncharacterized membrane protein